LKIPKCLFVLNLSRADPHLLLSRIARNRFTNPPLNLLPRACNFFNLALLKKKFTWGNIFTNRPLVHRKAPRMVVPYGSSWIRGTCHINRAPMRLTPFFHIPVWPALSSSFFFLCSLFPLSLPTAATPDDLQFWPPPRCAPSVKLFPKVASPSSAILF
jgi:hypothetical protein